MSRGLIDTDKFSATLREKAIDLSHHRLLVTNFLGSQQEQDLTAPANCEGFGRVRHFHRSINSNWPTNPLPIDPANLALGTQSTDTLRAQVFQNAACNWRCWYCFVDFALLAADTNRAKFFSASELIDLYLAEDNRPDVVDLTGGQPELTPEWVPWMMQELRNRGLDGSTYLWSDDNLSTDYFWKYLKAEDIDLIQSYKNYGKVCCFKGFDSESFSFNTRADPVLFDQQFELMSRYMDLDIDLYCYVTLTTPNPNSIDEKIKTFIDRLQELSPMLPLRTIPLEIVVFEPTKARLSRIPDEAISNQFIAIKAWNAELEKRFSEEERTKNITEIKISRILP